MSKQKLIIITGSPCVGKTTVADELFQSFENSAFLDGDWCWCVNPFSISDPRLRNGDKSMSFLLSNYLNSDFDYVVFSSVVVMGDPIRKNILNDITAKDFDVIGITLTCSEETLTQRHKNRGDDTEVSFYWLHLPPYPNDFIINTDNKDVNQIVAEIRELINQGEKL